MGQPGEERNSSAWVGGYDRRRRRRGGGAGWGGGRREYASGWQDNSRALRRAHILSRREGYIEEVIRSCVTASLNFKAVSHVRGKGARVAIFPRYDEPGNVQAHDYLRIVVRIEEEINVGYVEGYTANIGDNRAISVIRGVNTRWGRQQRPKDHRQGDSEKRNFLFA